ncbi:hypothetical protein L2E82_41686 [Cichorium intybus]|uniref:Uncharacterized protein n=1 Tax=Cichorium intybus TaxID=13427 RepID=A0ACB8ZLQ9_CICIN|nr:hypothetical protein L2E82_41686 [Cichorium intybus]
METVVPNLKHSLSLTLQHFFPFVSNLIVFPNPNNFGVIRKPEIRHVEGDSVTLTIAECDLDFEDLTSNHPRKCETFYPLVPPLGNAVKASDHIANPLFSVQVTLFREAGFSIGMTNHHSLADASARFVFLKAWNSIARFGGDESFLSKGSPPVYDRLIDIPKLFEHKLSQTKLETFYQPPALVPGRKIGIAGTPKHNFYDLDFGWGKPKKNETVSIDYNGSISINSCKESTQGHEIGLCFSSKQMEEFANIFNGGLES